MKKGEDTKMGQELFIYNHDVAGIYRRINRFIIELLKSVSANGSQMTEFDQTRLQSYLDAVKTYQAWIVDQPLLDLPETAPRKIFLDIAPEIAAMENESVRDVITLFELARDETINGQSARQSSNLTPFDASRLTAIVEKAQTFLDNYIKPTTPLDLPESSPMQELGGPGKTGV